MVLAYLNIIKINKEVYGIMSEQVWRCSDSTLFVHVRHEIGTVLGDILKACEKRWN